MSDKKEGAPAMHFKWHYTGDGAPDHGAPFGYFQTTKIKLAGKGNKGEIQLLRIGTFHHPKYGKFDITPEILATMVHNFKEVKPRPPTELMVDYEHQSTVPEIIATAAGWVEDLYTKAKGLFAKVRWTDEAAALIKADKYRFISPQFDLNDTDKESGDEIGACLLSVALTNRPFLDGMIPVVLCDSQEGAEILLSEQAGEDMEITTEVLVLSEGEDDAGFAGQVEESKTSALTGGVDNEGKGEKPDMDQEVRQALGLKDDAGVVASIVALKERAEKATEDAERVDIAQLRVAHLEGEIALKEKAEKESTAKEMVDSALNAGKITPKLSEWAMSMALSDPESFATFLEGATPIISTKELGDGGDGGNLKLTEMERDVAKNMGQTDAEFAAGKSK